MVELWSWRSGERGAQWEEREVRELAFSPDRRHLALARERVTVQVRELASGRPVAKLGSFGSYHVGFSPDGRYLATQSFLDAVTLWRVEDWAQVRTLGTREQCFTFTPDGRQLVSAAYADGTLSCWDMESGELLRHLRGQAADVSVLAVSPDGRWLAAAGRRQASEGSFLVEVWALAAGARSRRAPSRWPGRCAHSRSRRTGACSWEREAPGCRGGTWRHERRCLSRTGPRG